MTVLELEEHVAPLVAAAWPGAWDDARTGVWVRVLGDLSLDEVRAAVDRALRTPAQFAPTPGQVRAHIVAARAECQARTCREPKVVCSICRGTGWEYVTIQRHGEAREAVRRCACSPNAPTETADQPQQRMRKDVDA